jgi:enamine deaminase RidA (YjgF/YER057c/UK114 family)
MKTFRDPETIHVPLAAYSHHVEVRDAARTLHVSGQIGMTADGVLPDDPIEQLEIALDNVLRNVEAASMQLADLVKLTVFLVGAWDAAARREVVAAKLGGHRPAMTVITVAALATPQILVEVEATASADAEQPAT